MQLALSTLCLVAALTTLGSAVGSDVTTPWAPFGAAAGKILALFHDRESQTWDEKTISLLVGSLNELATARTVVEESGLAGLDCFNADGRTKCLQLLKGHLGTLAQLRGVFRRQEDSLARALGDWHKFSTETEVQMLQIFSASASIKWDQVRFSNLHSQLQILPLDSMQQGPPEGEEEKECPLLASAHSIGMRLSEQIYQTIAHVQSLLAIAHFPRESLGFVGQVLTSLEDHLVPLPKSLDTFQQYLGSYLGGGQELEGRAECSLRLLEIHTFLLDPSTQVGLMARKALRWLEHLPTKEWLDADVVMKRFLSQTRQLLAHDVWRLPGRYQVQLTRYARLRIGPPLLRPFSNLQALKWLGPLEAISVSDYQVLPLNVVEMLSCGLSFLLEEAPYYHAGFRSDADLVALARRYIRVWYRLSVFEAVCQVEIQNKVEMVKSAYRVVPAGSPCPVLLEIQHLSDELQSAYRRELPFFQALDPEKIKHSLADLSDRQKISTTKALLRYLWQPLGSENAATKTLPLKLRRRTQDIDQRSQGPWQRLVELTARLAAAYNTEGAPSVQEAFWLDFIKDLADTLEKVRALLEGAIGHLESTGDRLACIRSLLTLTPIMIRMQNLVSSMQGPIKFLFPPPNC